MIDAKLKGEGIEPEAPAEPRGDNVIDLMAALKRSLGEGKRSAATGTPTRKKAARAAAKKPKRAAARKRA